jgi:Transglycosylase-like domain
MPAAPRHGRRKATATRFATPATRRWALGLAAATLVGVTAVFVSLQGGSAAPRVAGSARPASTASGSGNLAAGVRGAAAALDDRLLKQAAIAARHPHQSAAPLAQQQGLQASSTPTPTPSASAGSTASQPPPSVGGGDAAHSALGDCIRNAEEGGSYAWGRGNGGGAYQFEEGTWEHYGGAASEYGVAGPAYQDQIFDNAIAAGGASNWTNYDGC